jgi:hypothetical protein
MLQQLVVLGNEADLPGHNKVKEFTCGDKTLCVANLEGVILAVDKESLHGSGAFVTDGNEQDTKLAFSPDWQWIPAADPIAVYPVKIENNKVLIQLQMADDQEAFADHSSPSIQ